MKNYHLAIATLLTSFCLTACDAQIKNRTSAVESPTPIQTTKLEVKKRLAEHAQSTKATKSITPASPKLQSQQVARPVNRPQRVDWQYNPQATSEAQTQPSTPQFNPRAARQAQIDAAVARGRRLNEERQAQDAAAVGAGAARGLDRATDIFTPSQSRVRR